MSGHTVTAGSRPTVCHVTSVHIPTDSRVLYHECRSLATRYRTLLVCRDDGPARTMEGVEIVPLPKSRGRLARFAGGDEIARAAEATGADVFHFHDPELIGPMSRLASRTGRPVIYDVHEYYPDAMMQRLWIPAPLRPLASAWADRAEKRGAPRMAAIVTADAALTQRFAPLNRRVVQLDNFPPLSLFGPPPTGPAPAPPTLVYVGSVAAVRGFFEMVEVLGIVRAEFAQAKLVVHGRVTEDVAPRLQETLRSLPDGAVVMSGAIEYGRIAEVLREAHVGLSLLRPHPKYEKNVSMKVFDYMAAGIPYVASDFTPLRAKTRGIGGELVAPGDPAAAAAAVLRLLRDPERAHAVGLEGRALVEAELDWDRVEPRLFALYEELLAR